MSRRVERIQTGVRLEKRLVKVMKGTAEYLDLSLGAEAVTARRTVHL